MTEAQKQVQIFRESANREDFINANVGDWIQGVGEITTIYERDFIRRYGSSLIPAKSEAVLEEFFEWINDQPQDCICHYDLWEKIKELRQQKER